MSDDAGGIQYLTLADLHGELLRLGLVTAEEIGYDRESTSEPREIADLGDQECEVERG